MNTIFQDSELSWAFTQIMRCIRNNNIDDLVKKYKRIGLVCTFSGAFFLTLFLILLAASIAIKEYTGACLCGFSIAGFGFLTLYGINRRLHPEKSRLISQYYPDIAEILSRNTGYPYKPYSEKEWEIPIKEYSQNVLQSLLEKGNGWGTNNVCFLALQIYYEEPRRREIYAGQFIINLCDEGIILMPIEYQTEDTPLALTGLTTVIPQAEIDSIRMKKETDSYRITIRMKKSKWLYAAGYYSSILELSVMEEVPEAPFHKYAVAKWKEKYSSKN